MNFGMTSDIKGEAMCIPALVKLIEFDELTDQQKKKLAAVKKRLQERKKALQETLDNVNQGLQVIERRAKR